MPRTVVVLPARWSGVLPVAAVPALRSAAHLHADETVPEHVRESLGVPRLDGTPDGVVFTTDPLRYPDADLVVSAPEPAGAALLDAVAVMDRLRSPGGCPWDAEQTHSSLLQHLVEECYELYEAIEDDDRPAMREELGDVLLQVLFHARVALDSPEPFGVDEVASGLVDKLIGRHPHVFGDDAGLDARVGTGIGAVARQEQRWEEIKRVEKQRESSVDGVPTGQPAVALAAKLTSRTARAGLPADLLPAGSGVGEQLFALAARARLGGIDPEAQLRAAARGFAADVRTAERSARDAGEDPHALDATAWKRHWPG